MTSNQKELAKRFLLEAYQNENYDTLNDILHPQYKPDDLVELIGHIQEFDFSSGVTMVKQRIKAIKTGLDELSFNILNIIEEGDTVFILYSMSAKHVGTYLGVPPTNKSFKALGLHYFKFKDNLIFRIGMIQDHYKVLLDLSQAMFEKNEENLIIEYLDNLKNLRFKS